MNESRYSWKKMPDDYNASYYNDKDRVNGKMFTVIDNKTGKEYEFPQVEIIEDSNGIPHNKIILQPSLCNEEFVAWAICTSKDFFKKVGKEWLTTNVLYYIVEHFEYPEIFNWNDLYENVLSEAMTGRLWNKAFQRNKEVVYNVPREYITSEMINSLGELKNPWFGHSINYNDLTPVLFEKMYFNSDTKHKLRLIPPVSGNYRSNPYDFTLVGGYSGIDGFGIVDNLISQSIADDILSIDIRTIWHIPKKFISEEVAIKAMETSILLIQYVPAKYQTIEYQKRAIDENLANLSLIDPTVLADEMIYYSISKNGSALRFVPKEKRTLEVCDLAVSLFGRAIRSVPNNVKNSQLCFKAVVNDPSAIEYVPVEFLTHEFVNSLYTAGIVIPSKNLSYVEKCLATNKRLEEQRSYVKEVADIKTKLDVSSEYYNIHLDTLSGLLMEKSLGILAGYGIFTVGDLLSMSDNSDLYMMILNNPKAVYKEIRGAIRLLKCKYMNLDPMIDFVDTGDAVEDMKDFSDKIGFSTRAENALCKGTISPKELCEIIKYPDREIKLGNIKNAGNTVVREIIFKSSIVADFNNKKMNNIGAANEDESIELLNEELLQIRSEINRLGTRIDEIIAKIQEKSMKSEKVGVLK